MATFSVRDRETNTLIEGDVAHEARDQLVDLTTGESYRVTVLRHVRVRAETREEIHTHHFSRLVRPTHEAKRAPCSPKGP
jgi:hypothetical protein